MARSCRSTVAAPIDRHDGRTRVSDDIGLTPPPPQLNHQVWARVRVKHDSGRFELDRSADTCKLSEIGHLPGHSIVPARSEPRAAVAAKGVITADVYSRGVRRIIALVRGIDTSQVGHIKQATPL